MQRRCLARCLRNPWRSENRVRNANGSLRLVRIAGRCGIHFDESDEDPLAILRRVEIPESRLDWLDKMVGIVWTTVVTKKDLGKGLVHKIRKQAGLK
jgi:hypothetical protein